MQNCRNVLQADARIEFALSSNKMDLRRGLYDVAGVEEQIIVE